VPCFDEFYGSALSSVELDPVKKSHVLDLGAGTGLFGAMVNRCYPNSRFHLIDLSSEMLEKAKTRFERMELPVPRTVVGDYSAMRLDGPYDNVISALSIHHLNDRAKQGLFKSIFSSLKNGGKFVNAEQVLGESPRIEVEYEKWWIDSALAKGATPVTLARAKERMKLDQCVSVKQQLEWMRAAGFKDTACVFQDHRFAVLSYSPILGQVLA